MSSRKVPTKQINSIEDLKQDHLNANEGTQRGHRIIEHSIRHHGAGRSGLAASDGTLIAGNQTFQKVAELGFKIKPVHTTGDEWVVVIRDDIEAGSDDAKLLALEDNRAAMVGIKLKATVLAELAAQLNTEHLFYPEEISRALAKEATAILTMPLDAPTADSSTDEGQNHSATPVMHTCPVCGHTFE